MYTGVHIAAPCGYSEAVSAIGIRELRAALSSSVRRARAGERLVITVDGESVAQLGPLHDHGHDSTLPDLVARGHLIAPRRRREFTPTRAVAMYAGIRIDRALHEVRR